MNNPVYVMRYLLIFLKTFFDVCYYSLTLGNLLSFRTPYLSIEYEQEIKHTINRLI
jgi:hypothetical protein